MACRKTFTLTFVVVVLIIVPLVHGTKFKDVFMKKCLEFKETRDRCESVWGTFERAYVGKDKCTVTPENYIPLMDEVPSTHACGKTMLWSKTNEVVHKFAGNGECFITMRHTLLGYVLNDLSWCGKKNSLETFTEHCWDCEPNPVSSFWTLASTRFAQHACDVVTVMLDGMLPEPYDPESFLGRYEIPNLNSPKVKKVAVILAIDRNENQCNKASLKNLKNFLKGKKIDYACEEALKTDLAKCKNGNRPGGHKCQCVIV
ncbi:ADP-ribosyl cyclase/cyclic ADP-ribose hydrolase 1-like [Cheilinus undulatus]|uniref:ADP-ribosyl cyclase/cyclic ADP-ribose hydrolase 1-like n=1 Tax=Cheilinus undulatus TaxID=241271 RepID=UPI001BD66450|nr:ADP-ribosyl cyclase/cyclic ADP-ribose hydrolase 1-like [Cheilinus undulatus]